MIYTHAFSSFLLLPDFESYKALTLLFTAETYRVLYSRIKIKDIPI